MCDTVAPRAKWSETEQSMALRLDPNRAAPRVLDESRPPGDFFGPRPRARNSPQWKPGPQGESQGTGGGA
eukprot:2210358-Alexandrium_andersonii.AAC.1